MSIEQVDLPSLAHPEKDPSWRKSALCLGVGPGPFFRERGSMGYSAERIMCAQCSVRENCLDFALENHIQHGFFGGFSKEDRQRINAGDMGREITMTQIVKDLAKLKKDNPIREASRLFFKDEAEIHEMLSAGK